MCWYGLENSRHQCREQRRVGVGRHEIARGGGRQADALSNIPGLAFRLRGGRERGHYAEE
eukprot:11160983-Lingulodinium_polyedra.AAC.1